MSKLNNPLKGKLLALLGTQLKYIKPNFSWIL